jgi:hypothetical protein
MFFRAVFIGFLICIFSVASKAMDTLKVVNWNLEWFGDNTSDLPQEIDKSRIIINKLHADVLALVEVVNVDSMHSLTASLDSNYSFIISDFGSFADDASDADYAGAQKLVFMYRTKKLRNVSGRAFLKTSSGNAYYNWSSGRYPFFVTAEVKDQSGGWQPIKFVVLHAKANSDNKSCSRRYEGSLEMKDSLDKYYPNDKLMVLGDFNDDFDVSICGGTSNYSNFVNDSAGSNYYYAPTLPLSLQGISTINGYTSFIDHVLLSNELKQDYVPGSAQVLKTEVNTWVSNYTAGVSDHYPVRTSYILSQSTKTADISIQHAVVNLYPNPATDFLMVERHDNSHERFEIFTANGKKVADGNLDEKITTIPVLNWCKGVYFIKLTGSITAVKQFIIAR